MIDRRGGAKVSRRALMSGAIALGATAAIGGVGAATTLAKASPAPKETGLSNEGLLKGEFGFQPRKPMALPHAEIPGFLTRNQLEQTYERYRHDFERLRVAEHALKRMPRDEAHARDYGAMRTQQVEAGNSVLLNELYFRGVTAHPAAPPQYMLDNMHEHMGSMESWRDDFIACARVAPAWAMLVYDPYDDRWHNVLAGSIDAGGWVGANPLIVCATVESAYRIDYAIRKNYVERFIDHIDWNVVAARYRAADRH